MGPDAPDDSTPSISILAIDSTSHPDSVTIMGTATDPDGVVNVTTRRRAEQCDPPVDTLPVSPGSNVPFSVTYYLGQLDREIPASVDIEAEDADGNRAKVTVPVVPDVGQPTLYMLAPVFAPTDSALISIASVDNWCGTLTVGYMENGNTDIAHTMTGVESPYPLWPLQYLFATTISTPIGRERVRATVIVRDESGNGRLGSKVIRRASRTTKVVGGLGHWCVLDADGAAWCWGNNHQGQLGTGRTDSTHVPNRVIGDITFRDIEAAFLVSCGITDLNELYCWGALGWEEIHNAIQPTESATAPVRFLPGLPVQAVAPGWGHTCALLTDGRTVCWGLNSEGQLGDSTTIRRSEPAVVAGEHRFAQLVSGALHTCGLTEGGAAYCWGRNYRGNLGIGDATVARRTVPTRVATTLSLRTLSAGWDQVCAIASDGFAYCWGDADNNRLGVGIGLGAVTVPTRVQIDEPTLTISVTSRTGCAITVSLQTYCWGSAHQGQLGTPFRNPFSSVHFSPLLTAYGLPLEQINTGDYGTCAVSETSALYCWGSADIYGRVPVVNQ